MLGSLKGQATSAMKGAAGRSMNDPSRKRLIFYCIFSCLAGVLVGLTSLHAKTNPQQAFLFSMISFTMLGALHVWLMYQHFPWAGKGYFYTESWFTLLISAFLMTFYAAIYYFILHHDVLLFSGSILLFFLPLLVHWSFHYASLIPQKDYKKWMYPDKPVIADMDNIDLSNFAIITFIFSKKDGDNARSNFQSKAPYPIRLGDLFYFFIEEWNHENPGSTIQYLDETNKTFGWYFYIKKAWWRPKKYLDADHTVRENKIGVNEIIVTERVNL